jgi:Fuc2NAc and GlcNAc transferase
MTNAVIVVSAFVLTWILTGLARAYALRRSLIDVPNQRSSHQQATPRGGGIAIVVTVLTATIYLVSSGRLSSELAMAILLGGGAVALVGWLDDHRPLGVGMRAAVHLLAATLAVGLSYYAHPSGFASPPLALLTAMTFILGIAWFTNLFNFLDGTDGYAGIQSLCAALAGAAIFVHGREPGAVALCLAVAAASGGFLPWNWAPARIFMGDVGSCFLGFLFGVLALYGHVEGVAPAWIWIALLGVFFWDATLTLARRVLAGERWYAPHKSHAYQRLHQMGWGHDRIAVAALCINVFVLWPVVWAAVVWDNFSIVGVAAVSAMLAGLWWAVNRIFRELSP